MPNIGYFPVTGYPKPLSVGPEAFISETDAQDWTCTDEELRNRAILTMQRFYTPLVLPNGVTIKKITLYGWRQGATDTLVLYLRSSDRQGGGIGLAGITADWTGGYGSKETTEIAGMPIDNTNKTYVLRLDMDPDASVNDGRFTGAVIDWQ